MKKLLAAFLLSISATAFAADGNEQSKQVDVSGLTDTQVAHLEQQAREMKEQPENVSAAVRKEAEAWGELGTNMGKAMVGAAHELGVAANEFANTPLGKVVVVIVAYKLVGNDLIGVVLGTFVMIFGYSTALWIFTTRRWSEVTYNETPVLWGLYNRKQIVSCNTSDDVVQVKLWIGLIVLALTTVVSSMMIF